MATPMLVPLLFVAGALFAIGAARSDVDRPVQSDLPTVSDSVDPATAVTAVEPGDEPEATGIEAPSALIELQMIAEFVGSAPSAKPPTPDADRVPPFEPAGPPPNDIGAI